MALCEIVRLTPWSGNSSRQITLVTEVRYNRGQEEDMTRVPLTEEQVAEDWLVLNVENVRLTDEQFVDLCVDNREFVFELTAQKELVIMPLPGPKTSRRNTIISTRLENWAEKDGTGIAFGPTLFALPNGARRAPDACWLRREQWDALTVEEQERLSPLRPDFVLELMSPSDRRPARFRMLQAKMAEYVANGARLGWLIDPFKKNVYVYRPGEPVCCLKNPATIHGEPVLPGFVLQVSEIW
jgi:Uma2 family endonuclease